MKLIKEDQSIKESISENTAKALLKKFNVDRDPLSATMKAISSLYDHEVQILQAKAVNDLLALKKALGDEGEDTIETLVQSWVDSEIEDLSPLQAMLATKLRSII
jgi:hypothetical protein